MSQDQQPGVPRKRLRMTALHFVQASIGIPGGPKGSQEEPRGAWRSKEESGGVWRTKEDPGDPGGARRSQKSQEQRGGA